MKPFETDPYHIKVAEKILLLLEGYNFVVLDAPTASRKSSIAYWIHKLSEDKNPSHKTVILNHQKVLQDQYDQLLSSLSGVLVIKGKSNYKCYMMKHITVDQAPCQTANRCVLKDKCEYFIKRENFKTFPLGITNYSQAWSLIDADQYFRNSQVCIEDEQHVLGQLFADFRTVTVNNETAKYYSNMADRVRKFLKIDEQLISDLNKAVRFTNETNWAKRLPEIFEIKIGIMESLKENFFGENFEYWFDKHKELVLDINRFLNIEKQSRMQYVIWKSHPEIEYVYRKNDESFDVLPLMVGKLILSPMATIASKHVLMSSTVFDHYIINELGITNFEKIVLPNKIHRDNRPVLYSPVAKFNAANTKKDSPEFKDLTGTIIDILKMQKGDSGVIFCPSYRMAEDLYNAVEHQARKLGYNVLINYSADQRDSTLEKFRLGKNNLLITPSFMEGVNFEDDVSRFQIITKIPFKSLGDQYIKTKMKRCEGWYEIDAITTIVQSCGRSIRHINDNAITFILDENWGRLQARYEYMMPKWFLDSIQKI